MSSFDVFVRGIRPERLDDSEQIKKKSSQFFKIAEDQLEAAWSARGGLCVFRNLSEEEAQKLQTNLAKGGLICIYRPGKTGVGLALVSEHKETTERVFTCPSCKHKVTLKANETDPVKCGNCFVIISVYLDKQKQKEEREEIKRRLLKSKASIEIRETEQQKEEAERKRKQQLEEEIENELFGTKRKKLIKNIVLGSSAAIVLISTGIGYTYLNKHDKQLTVTISGNELPSVEVKNQPLKGGEQLIEGGDGMQTEGQQAMQDTYQKANKVLGAFGLDAGKFAENTGGGTASQSTAKVNTVSPETEARNSQNAITSTSSLLLGDENNQEFDLMVNKGVISLIKRNDLDEAFQLGQYLVDTDLYINAMGQLLAFVQHEKK